MNNAILSFVLTAYPYTGGTGAPIKTYHTINVDKCKTLQLKDFFKADSDYINVINNEIKEQIKTQIKEDESKCYFDGDMGFKSISDNQKFYIEDKSIVIAFDKYEIAPGCMRTPEFKISIIQNKRYIEIVIYILKSC